MANYQRYAEYKDSGVEWLGEIPSHWIGTQVKYGYQVTLGKMLQSSPKSFQDELKPYLKAQNIQPKGISLIQVEEMWFSPDECKKLLLKKGDVLVSEGGDVGRSAIWNAEIEECYIQNAINRVRPKNTHDAKFFLYWMLFLKSTDFINIICNKATIAHYTAEKLEASPLVLPTSDEQVQIANFLDHETAKIDSLIEKQQKLIELLKEKRQAVISHAVTKGLNPDVPMKDSGVEWLGQVPEHWQVIKFGITNQSAVLGGNYISSEGDDGVPVIKMGNLGRGNISLVKVERLKKNEAYESEHTLKKGDFLFNTRNSLDLVGKVSIWREELDKAVYNSNILRISFNKLIGSSEYVSYLFNSDLGLSQLRLIAKGTTNVAAIYYKDLSGLVFAYPPTAEQNQIVSVLDDSCASLDMLILKAESAIHLMQERRTALISAAVTGKIDVRNWQAPNATEREMEVST